MPLYIEIVLVSRMHLLFLNLYFAYICCEISDLQIYSFTDIQILMGSLVYLRQGIENSPYVHLLDANQWADICDIFTRDACALLGLSVESPLSVRYGCFPI